MRMATLLLALFVTLAGLALPAVPASAVSTNIVISEFRTRGPAGGNDEFIELYNLSSAPVTIGGWKVNGSNNAGTTSTRATITAGIVLNPGCHYLLTNNATGGYSGAVPGNQTYNTGITDDGGIALLTAANVIVDQVGMSTGSAYKEGTILTPLTTNLDRGYERLPGGINGSGQDTDNNVNDFHLVAPNAPENLASACIAATPADGTTWGALKILYR